MACWCPLKQSTSGVQKHGDGEAQTCLFACWRQERPPTHARYSSPWPSPLSMHVRSRWGVKIESTRPDFNSLRLARYASFVQPSTSLAPVPLVTVVSPTCCHGDHGGSASRDALIHSAPDRICWAILVQWLQLCRVLHPTPRMRMFEVAVHAWMSIKSIHLDAV
jgi:hypothetical protein